MKKNKPVMAAWAAVTIHDLFLLRRAAEEWLAANPKDGNARSVKRALRNTEVSE